MRTAERVTPALLTVFFAFAAAVAAAAAVTLVRPGTPLDAIWAIKPAEYRMLLDHGLLTGTGFALVATICGAACLGVARRRKWGLWLAMAIVATNLAGDLAHLAMDFTFAGIAGPVIALALLRWLWQRPVRALFGAGG